MKKLLLIGFINNFCLETSYAEAATHLGYEILRIDPAKEIEKYIKFGKLGRKLQLFLPVETWNRQNNRDVVIRAKEFQPDAILVFGTSDVLFGALATIKTQLPSCQLIWIWPDTPLNLNYNNFSCASLFDQTATYSRESIQVFHRIGCRNVYWLPLGGDTFMHGIPPSTQDSFNCDISFVGMWRPERERVMDVLQKTFGNKYRMEIHGLYWRQKCENPQLKNIWKGNGFYGKPMAEFFDKSRININVIDDTNYPAANMRFFEICTSGGLEAVSSCPEMESIFRHRKELVYFKDNEDLVNQINWILNNPDESQIIRAAGQRMIKDAHSYVHRLEKVISSLNQ